MTDREKLIERINLCLRRLFADVTVYAREYAKYGGYSGYKEFSVGVIAREIVDYLLANGVTIVTDANVGLKWIPVTERLPDEYVSVLGHMTDTDGFPSVRECFLTGNEFWFPALLTTWPVDRWAELPEV